MIDILLVDDSELEQRLAAELLRNNLNYGFRFAENGRMALAAMQDVLPELVVTDLVMPEMDGLELVKAIRLQYPQVPVVLMTAYGDQSLAVASLEQGAVSYVSKASQAEQLLATVDRVVARIEIDRHADRLWGCLTNIDCSFLLDNDRALITMFVDMVQRIAANATLGDAIWRIGLGIALEEALLNAMHHDNLQHGAIPQAAAPWKGQGELNGGSIATRSPPIPLCDRQIGLDVHLSRDGARFVIRDHGEDLDVTAESMRRLSSRLELGERRGMQMLRTLMDEVIYNDVGNQVTLYKRGGLYVSDEGQHPAEGHHDNATMYSGI